MLKVNFLKDFNFARAVYSYKAGFVKLWLRPHMPRKEARIMHSRFPKPHFVQHLEVWEIEMQVRQPLSWYWALPYLPCTASAKSQ